MHEKCKTMSDIMKFDFAARKQEWAERRAVVGKGGNCYLPVNLLRWIHT
jgi:hypothetical protein